MTTALREAISKRYGVEEYVCLDAQRTQWQASRPLDGIRIVDFTPVFRNTLTKYEPLIAAGAELVIGLHPQIPADAGLVAELSALGLRTTTHPTSEDFDLVLDCAGKNADLAANFGHVELTQSGIAAYKGSLGPVVVVDMSDLKLLETVFGTGDSYFRALEHLCVPAAEGPVLIFGGGKVGTGIAYAAQQRSIEPIIVDFPGSGLRFVDTTVVSAADPDAVKAAITRAHTIVTATGKRNSVAQFAEALTHSNALLANMGVDDEFGAGVPAERVLHSKVPVNFVLDEPTLLTYLDPVFALSNAAAVQLVAGETASGISAPLSDTEEKIRATLTQTETHVQELAAITTIAASRRD